MAERNEPTNEVLAERVVCLKELMEERFRSTQLAIEKTELAVDLKLANLTKEVERQGGIENRNAGYSAGVMAVVGIVLMVAGIFAGHFWK